MTGPGDAELLPPAASCAPDGHCVTCSDEGVPMRVASVDVEAGLATCEDERGTRVEVLTALVEDVTPGDFLLVHAGTALLRLDPRQRNHA